MLVDSVHSYTYLCVGAYIAHVCAEEIEMKPAVHGGQSSSDGEANSDRDGSTAVELDGNRKPSFSAELSSVACCFTT